MEVLLTLSIMTRSQFKFLVVVFSVLALWRVFEIPAVSEAFWAFCTVGAIPGTDYEMGADAMLRLLCVIFAVAFFLIFRKEFMNSLPENFLRRSRQQGVSGAEPAAVPKATQILLTINQQVVKPRPVFIHSLIVVAATMAIWLVRATVHAEALSKRLMIAAAGFIRVGVMTLYKHVRPFVLRLYRIIFVAARFVARALIMAWQLAKPYIKTFDHWLEAQLRANPYTNEAVRFMDDAVRVSKDIGTKAQATTRKLLADK